MSECKDTDETRPAVKKRGKQIPRETAVQIMRKLLSLIYEPTDSIIDILIERELKNSGF